MQFLCFYICWVQVDTFPPSPSSSMNLDIIEHKLIILSTMQNNCARQSFGDVELRTRLAFLKGLLHEIVNGLKCYGWKKTNERKLSINTSKTLRLEKRDGTSHIFTNNCRTILPCLRLADCLISRVSHQTQPPGTFTRLVSTVCYLDIDSAV
jgi:hypothetical protein